MEVYTSEGLVSGSHIMRFVKGQSKTETLLLLLNRC